MKKGVKVLVRFRKIGLIFLLIFFLTARVEASEEVLTQQENRPAYVPGEVIVKYKSSFQPEALSQFEGQFSIASVEPIPDSEAQVLHIGTDDSVEQAVEALNASGLVEYAQPNYRYYPAVTYPSDTFWNLLWGLDNNLLSGVDLQAPEAWDYTSNLKDVIVAVIDMGIDMNHPDLKSKIWTNPGEIPNNGQDDDHNGLIDDVNGWDFANDDKTVFDSSEDGEGHGTHVSGIIGAQADSGGVIGVTQNAKIMPLKFINSEGGTSTGLIAAISYAKDKGAKVVNISATAPPSSDDKAVNKAMVNSGLLFCVAAGNEATDIDRNAVTPGSLTAANMLVVAAVDQYANLAYFSNYGKKSVDVGAPGVNIYSDLPNNQYGYLSGTSMATPYVSGVAAALLGQKNLSTTEAIELIKSSGNYLDSLANKTATSKMVNLYNVIATQVTQPSVILNHPAANCPTSYTISFRTGSYGKLVSNNTPKDQIILTFPEGTILPQEIRSNKIKVNGTAVGSASQCISPEGQTLRINVPVNIGHNGQVTLVIDETANIINPVDGSYNLSVATSADPLPSQVSYRIDGVAPTWSNGSLTSSDLTHNSLRLHWSGAQDNIGVVSYRVDQDGNPVATVSGNDYDVKNLKPTTSYTFRVEAGDAAGNWSNDGPSIPVKTADTPPVTWNQGSLTTSHVTQNSLTLQWSGSIDSTGVVSYQVYQDNTVIATVYGDVYHYNVTGLNADTSYTFKVEAGDAQGNWSNDGPSTTVTTPADSKVGTNLGGGIGGGSGGGSGGGGASGGPGPMPSPEPKIEGKHADISELAHLERGTNSDGTSSVKVVLDNDSVTKALANNGVDEVIVKIGDTATEKVVDLPTGVFEQLAQRHGALVIQTNQANLSLPGELINSEALAKQLGMKPDHIQLKVTQSSADFSSESKEKTSAENAGLKPVSPVLQFNLMAMAGGTTCDIHSFGGQQVQGEIPLTPEELNNVKELHKLNLYKYDETNNQWIYVPSRVDEANHKVLFQTGTFSKYALMEWNQNFKDLENHWAKADVELMAAKQIVRGDTPDRFAPEREITRAEFAALLVRALGLTLYTGPKGQFQDVTPEAWYYGSVEAAAQAGLVKGAGEGIFAPNQGITRAEMAAMLMRALAYTGTKVELNSAEQTQLLDGYEDKNAVPDWAENALAQAIQTGVMKGISEKTLAPETQATRAQGTVMIRRIMERAGLL